MAGRRVRLVAIRSSGTLYQFPIGALMKITAILLTLDCRKRIIYVRRFEFQLAGAL